MNIFDEHNNAELLARIDKLTQDAAPQWGKMSVSQMLVHCQKPIEVLTGELKLSGGLLGFLFGKMAKNNFLKMKGFNKNAPTHPTFRVKYDPDFEEEKQKLRLQVAAFTEKGPGIIAVMKHPFFGPMTEEEWGMLMYLHLDHHLKQFGV